ncbi:MAG: glycosyltransferase [Alphaproteobacteria bacterium]
MSAEIETFPAIGRNGPSTRKRAIVALADRLAPERRRWMRRNAYYYEEDYRYMRFLVPPGRKVLVLGCGAGDLLAALDPTVGVGIDMSPRMIEVARAAFPQFAFHAGDIEDPAVLGRLDGPYDVIVLADTIGLLEDCETTLASLHALCTRETRLIVAYYSKLWQPVLTLAERLGLKMPQVELNWLSADDIEGLLGLADFDIIKREWRLLLPKRLFGLGRFVNRYLAALPGLRRLCLRTYAVARPGLDTGLGRPSCTVVVPCRNERGNIRPLIERLPRFCPELEVVFVEGHSGDGTWDAIGEVAEAMAATGAIAIRRVRQDGRGKGDAVRKGFAEARGEVLVILDADMAVPPEAVPKFYAALVAGKGNFITGTRLVYPREPNAMPLLNLVGNRAFSLVFTWLLNQRFTDTLCGTKALTRAHYQRIAEDRGYFGEFDPFGDFDLIFGAVKQNLKVVEIPIRYAARGYGETQISRFRDGVLLLRMVLFAWRKLKAI